ncbi:MAG TPA: serine hydrolase domain-containing protein [Solirubrobacterales bacterium]|nr:serine hydrolase domain-containing protein [Solirubrobacterales bacterium]
MRPRRSRAGALIAFLALASALLLPAAAAAKFRSAANSELQRALEKIVAAPGGPPGVSVLIDRGRHMEFLGAGVAEVGSGRPPTPWERFRIASVSKGFNSYIAMKLLGETPLALETTLGETIPGVLPAAEGVKLRELLQHTSGLADYIRAPAFVEAFLADPTAYLSPTQLTGFVREAPLEFAPGSRYHYSDTDNIAAAMIEEAVAGRSYEQLLAREVFGPLKMHGSSLPRTPKLSRPFMHGYDIEPGKKPEDVSRLLNPAGAWASGGIVSIPLDLAGFARRYVPTVLRGSAGLQGAFRPGSSSPPGPGKNSAGLGIFRYRTGCGSVYGHTGSFPGYRVLLAASASGRRSVVFVANAQIVPGQGSAKVAKAITRAQARAICRALS